MRISGIHANSPCSSTSREVFRKIGYLEKDAEQPF